MNAYFRPILLSIFSVLIASCGGGGGSGSSNDSTSATPLVFEPALEFEQPDLFINGESFTTTQFTVRIVGGLNSVTIPRGFCPDSTPPQNFSTRWQNVATGDSGSTQISVGCVSNSLFGVPLEGVDSVFVVDSVALELGTNQIRFETFEGSEKIGEDSIVIVREDREAPLVSYTYPGGDAEDVPVNHSLIVLFSEAMNETTLTADRWRVTDSLGNSVSGNLVYTDRNTAWTFKPDIPLSTGETYQVVIDGAVADTGGNNPLGDDVTWSFKTGSDNDITEPVLDETWPGAGCDCSHPSTRVLTKFDHPIDPSSVNDATLHVATLDSVPVDGTVTYGGDFIEFEPGAPLLANTTYKVTVASGVKDPAGLSSSANMVWEFSTGNDSPVGSWSEMTVDDQMPALSGHSAVVTDLSVFYWAGAGVEYRPSTDTWHFVSSVGAPAIRFEHGAIWTGNEMIIWGGHDNEQSFNDGGIYHPMTDSWETFSLPQRVAATYNHAIVWTGSEMIVWGGIDKINATNETAINRGFRFDPLTQAWEEISQVNAPSPRHSPEYAWIGSQLLIWGGKSIDGEPLSGGALYDPASDTWTTISDINAPEGSRADVIGVWTGSELLVWNGGRTDPDMRLNNRFRTVSMRYYNPVTDTWRTPASGWEPFVTTTSLITNLPSGFYGEWTGDELFVLGKNSLDDAWLYDPISESWQIASTEGAPFFFKGSATVWTHDRFILWGGTPSVLPLNTGRVFAR